MPELVGFRECLHSQVPLEMACPGSAAFVHNPSEEHGKDLVP